MTMRLGIAALALACATLGGAVRAEVAVGDGAAAVDPAQRAREILRDGMYQRRMPGDRAPIQSPTPNRRARTGPSGGRDATSRAMPPPLTTGESAAFEGLGWVLGGLVVAFVVPALWRAAAALRRPGRAPTPAHVGHDGATTTPEPRDGRMLARQLAQDGLFGDAVLALWREALANLQAETQDAGGWPAALTGREISAALESRGVVDAAHRVHLQTLLFHMEAAVFGPTDLNSEDFARCDAAFAALFKAHA